MRFINHIKVISSSLLLLALAACGSTETRRGTGAYFDDVVISGKVKAALLAHPDLKGSEINVETYKGSVQLSGFVGSPDDIPAALALARKVDGVRSVRNDIVLRR